MSETSTNSSNNTQSIWKQAGFLQRINKLALPQTSLLSNSHNLLSGISSTVTNGVQFDVIQQTLKLFRHIKKKQQEQEKQLHQRSPSECSSEKSSDSDTDNSQDFEEMFSIWDECESRINGYFDLESLSCSELYKLRSITGEDWVSDQTALTNFSIIQTLALNQVQEKLKLQEKLKQSQSQLYLLSLQANNKSNKSPIQPKRIGLLPFPASNELVHSQTTEQLLKETSKITINPEIALTDSFKAFNAYFSATIKLDQLKNRHPNYSRYSKYYKSESQMQHSLEASAAEIVKKKFLVEQTKAESVTNRKRKSKSLYQQSQNFPTSSTYKTTLDNGIGSDDPFAKFLGFQGGNHRQQEQLPGNKNNFLQNNNEFEQQHLISKSRDSSPLRVQLRQLSSVKSPFMNPGEPPSIGSTPVMQPQQSIQNLSPQNSNLSPISPLKKRAISLKSMQLFPSQERNNMLPVDYSNKFQNALSQLPTQNPQSLVGIVSQEDEDIEEQLTNESSQQQSPRKNSSQNQLTSGIFQQPFVLRSHVDFNIKSDDNSSKNLEQLKILPDGNLQRRQRSTPHLRVPSVSQSIVFSPDQQIDKKIRLSHDRIESVITLLSNSKRSDVSFSPSKGFSPRRRPLLPLPFVRSSLMPTSQGNSFLPRISGLSPEMSTLKNAQAHLQEPQQMLKLNLFKTAVQNNHSQPMNDVQHQQQQD